MSIEHNAVLYWDNGEGETPCSQEYLELFNQKNAIYSPGRDYEMCLDDLDIDDYEAWNRLDDKLLGMQADGHIGKSIRY